MAMLVSGKDEGDFWDKKKRNRAKHRPNPRGKPEDKFTFQLVSNLRHKAKYTLELLTKTTFNVPEWPSYSFDLNQLENLWQYLKIAV